MKNSKSLISKIGYLTLILLLLSSFIYGQEQVLPIYKDQAKSFEQRTNDLIKRMTLSEKVDLVSGLHFISKKNIRLGIPELLMCDGPQGPNVNGRTTHYSAAINYASSFNTDLIYTVASNIGEETRILGRNMILAPMIASLAPISISQRGNVMFGKPTRRIGTILPMVAEISSPGVGMIFTSGMSTLSCSIAAITVT